MDRNWTSESPLVDQDGTYQLHVRELVNGSAVATDTIDFTIDRVAPNKPSLAPALSHGFLGTDQASTTITGESEALAEIKLLARTAPPSPQPRQQMQVLGPLTSPISQKPSNPSP